MLIQGVVKVTHHPCKSVLFNGAISHFHFPVIEMQKSSGVRACVNKIILFAACVRLYNQDTLSFNLDS